MKFQEFLEQTWDTLQRINGHETNSSGNELPRSTPHDAFEAYLDNLDSSVEDDQKNSLIEQLTNLSRLPRLKLKSTEEKKETLLDYWFEQKKLNPTCIW